MMNKAILPAVAALALAACDFRSPAVAFNPEAGQEDPVVETADCPALDARGWTAAVRGPLDDQGRAQLVLSGEVDLPTPGFTLTLTPGRADRSSVPTQVFHLAAQAPDGIVSQVVTTETASYEGLAIAQHFRAIRIQCGDRVLTEITDIASDFAP